jgi:hypothetical protein
MPTNTIDLILYRGKLFNLGKGKRSMSLRVYTHSAPEAYALVRQFGGSMSKHMRFKSVNCWVWSLSKREGLLKVYQALPLDATTEVPDHVRRLRIYLENFGLLTREGSQRSDATPVQS